MVQMIISPNNDYLEFDQWLKEKECKKLLLVCDDSIRYMEAFCRHLEHLEMTGIPIVRFRDFQPNPQYESVRKGVALFRNERCDSIMAVGGGSAIDVAKCIKLYAFLPGDGSDGTWLCAVSLTSELPFLVMPTTAGTGSEATRYAVVYDQGAKQSVTSTNCIPDTVLMDPKALKTLPLYQKKATMCDALCHAIESFWSVNSTQESKAFSKAAIEGVLNFMDGYLANTEKGNAGMLLAAHMAGKAINITQTTAGHAMCYKITSLFRAAHGHAAILCNRVLFPWVLQNVEKCVDPRGKDYLIDVLHEISSAMGCTTPEQAAYKLEALFEALELEVPAASAEQFEELKKSVNLIRLQNFPVDLDEDTIDKLYHKILDGKVL